MTNPNKEELEVLIPNSKEILYETRNIKDLKVIGGENFPQN